MIGPDDAHLSGAVPSRSFAPPRLVLAVGLLLLGIGNLLAIDLVLLPRTLGGTRAAPHRPALPLLPVGAPEPLPVVVMTAPPALPLPAAAAVAAPATPSTPTEPAVPKPEAPPASLPPLLFPQNATWLSPAAHKTLATLAALMKENPTLKIELDGHTDDLGPERFNRLLSLKRARRAQEGLQALGVDPTRVDVQGFGSAQPADQSQTARARARNRRVEIALR
jgi:outer membrane protein OmpA-like peptidoglycan-associated protein